MQRDLLSQVTKPGDTVWALSPYPVALLCAELGFCPAGLVGWNQSDVSSICNHSCPGRSITTVSVCRGGGGASEQA